MLVLEQVMVEIRQVSILCQQIKSFTYIVLTHFQMMVCQHNQVFLETLVNHLQDNNILARTTFYSNMNVQRRIPFKYSEKTDIQFQLRTNSGTHEMNVFGEGILVDVPRTRDV